MDIIYRPEVYNGYFHGTHFFCQKNRGIYYIFCYVKRFIAVYTKNFIFNVKIKFLGGTNEKQT